MNNCTYIDDSIANKCIEEPEKQQENGVNEGIISDPFVSEITIEIKERNLLEEARHINFKTPEEGEAFLREENSSLENPMAERALTARIEILKEEITAAQEKRDNNNEFDMSECIH